MNEPLDLSITADDILESRKHAGFDYRATILELRKHITDNTIGFYMGYGGTNRSSTVGQIVNGDVVPPHDKGEMLWSLYVLLFDKKPPMTETQAAGLIDDAFLASVRENFRKR